MLAATGYQALYDLEISSDYEYFIEHVEDTHVETINNGYSVHLYEYHYGAHHALSDRDDDLGAADRRIEGEEIVLAAAEREVLEETGYQTHGHKEVYTYHPLNGISNMQVYVVHCRAGMRSAGLDENEVNEIGWFNPQELRAMIRRREITDGFALIGLLLRGESEIV